MVKCEERGGSEGERRTGCEGKRKNIIECDSEKHGGLYQHTLMFRKNIVYGQVLNPCQHLKSFSANFSSKKTTNKWRGRS